MNTNSRVLHVEAKGNVFYVQKILIFLRLSSFSTDLLLKKTETVVFVQFFSEFSNTSCIYLISAFPELTMKTKQLNANFVKHIIF